MNKKLKVTISIIASMIIIIGSAFTIYAATTEYSLKSHGIIAHDGDGDGAYTNTAKDIYIDSGDLKTINDAVVAGKTSLASAINSATASSATNKTTLGTTDANLPAFNDLKNAIANVKAAGNEEGIITGQNNVINNVGGKTSATLGADGSLTLGYDGTTGTSSVANPTWDEIKTQLAGKTDSAGNPIYAGVTNIESLKNAITADNDNYLEKNKSSFEILAQGEGIVQTTSSKKLDITIEKDATLLYRIKHASGTGSGYGLDCGARWVININGYTKVNEYNNDNYMKYKGPDGTLDVKKGDHLELYVQDCQHWGQYYYYYMILQ